MTATSQMRGHAGSETLGAMGTRSKLNFFICGVQKAGTTALDHFLRGHPAVQMARIKEVHFFDDDTLDWDAPDYARLHDYFDDAVSVECRGEATPNYVYWPQAMERLHAYNPHARLILLLRHPVSRAFSHWRMETIRGLETLPFSTAIRPTARERVRLAPGGVHRRFSYVERGFYAPQVERILHLFPADQLLVLRMDAFWNDPGGALAEVQSFLGIESIIQPDRRYVVFVDSGESAPLPPDDADYLTQLYADDIRRTQSLTGLDLDDWLETARFLDEPMRS